MRILVLNGPNLNLLGDREPSLYGTTSLGELEEMLRAEAASLGVALEFFQSNHEGALIDCLHGARRRVQGVLVNPGALTHTSVALLDALLAVDLPAVEVHLTLLARREAFRQESLTARGVSARVEGFGVEGYRLALVGLVERLRTTVENV
jgi:3-dehydroquinate dehydratase-2